LSPDIRIVNPRGWDKQSMLLCSREDLYLCGRVALMALKGIGWEGSINGS
jgi:hypothetical protein